MLVGLGTRAIGRRLTAVVGALVVGAGLVAVQPVPPAAVGAAGETVTKFPDATINQPTGIVTGPDGNLWFTNFAGNSIGRITPAGVVTRFTDATISGPEGITAGPDGNLWFTNGNFAGQSIGRITPAGVVTRFTDPSISTPEGITAGPDGNLWFTNRGGHSIGRITPVGIVTSFSDVSIVSPSEIAAGPDGNLWYTTLLDGNSIGRITTAGVITNFTDPKIHVPLGIAAGPDGNLWFTNVNDNSIGRITPTGVVTTFHDATVHAPWYITAGPDGNMWFGNLSNASVGRISPAGIVTDVPDATIDFPSGITTGPDGNIWFTNTGNNSIGRVNVLPSIGIGNASALEGDAGARAVAFTVSLSQPSSTAVTARYRTVADTATVGDFGAKSGTVTIPAGATSATIAVALTGDTATESNEQFSVRLSSPVGATITRAKGVGTIINDDPDSGLKVGIGSGSVLEGRSGDRALLFTVTLSAAAPRKVKVPYATIAGTATAGDDFVAASGTVRIQAGKTAATIAIAIKGDATVEPSEAFAVKLSGVTGRATIARATGTGTILNDD